MLFKIRGVSGGCLDMIASDFRYHQTCMNQYMGKTKPKQYPENPYDLSFYELTNTIDKALFQDKRVFFISTLVLQYREKLAQYDIKMLYHIPIQISLER